VVGVNVQKLKKVVFRHIA